VGAEMVEHLTLDKDIERPRPSRPATTQDHSPA